MCTDTQNCLCHLIEPVIIADKGRHVRAAYFDPRHDSELYNFLAAAYPIMNEEIEEHLIAGALKSLYIQFIERPSTDRFLVTTKTDATPTPTPTPTPINMEDETTLNAFIAAYDKGKGDYDETIMTLKILRNSVHKMIYNNFSEEFIDFVKTFKEKPAIIEKHKKRLSFASLFGTAKDPDDSGHPKTPRTPHPLPKDDGKDDGKDDEKDDGKESKCSIM